MALIDTIMLFNKAYDMARPVEYYLDCNERVIALSDLAKLLDNMPAIEPERKIGTWEPVEEIPSIRKRFKRYCCSNCKKEGFDTWNFCPKCGQRNREVEEPEDIPMEYFESGGR